MLWVIKDTQQFFINHIVWKLDNKWEYDELWYEARNMELIALVIENTCEYGFCGQSCSHKWLKIVLSWQMCDINKSISNASIELWLVDGKSCLIGRNYQIKSLLQGVGITFGNFGFFSQRRKIEVENLKFSSFDFKVKSFEA